MAPPENPQTILVVEDDDITNAGFGAVLSEHGYRVVMASNGREALDYLRDNSDPDLILLDMKMPGISGWRFLSERGFHWRSIPVLITTALGEVNDGWAYSLGAVGVIQKPIDMDALLKRVQACLDRSEPSLPATR